MLYVCRINFIEIFCLHILHCRAYNNDYYCLLSGKLMDTNMGSNEIRGIRSSKFGR